MDRSNLQIKCVTVLLSFPSPSKVSETRFSAGWVGGFENFRIKLYDIFPSEALVRHLGVHTFQLLVSILLLSPSLIPPSLPFTMTRACKNFHFQDYGWVFGLFLAWKGLKFSKKRLLRIKRFSTYTLPSSSCALTY